MKRFNPLRLERLEDRMTPSGVTDPMLLTMPLAPDASTPVQISPMLPVTPDVSVTTNVPAPPTGDMAIMPVDPLFVSNGGGTISYGIGLGVVGPNGPVDPLPPPSGPTGLLPVLLPTPPAFGNLYPTTPVTPIDMTPVTATPAPPIQMTP